MTAKTVGEKQLLNDAARIARDIFAINGSATRLFGCDGHNFRIKDDKSGKSWVLKLSHPEQREVIALQQSVLDFLSSRDTGVTIQPVRRPVQDDRLPTVDFDGGHWLVWAVGYLPGRVLASAAPGQRVPFELGSVMGRLDRTLAAFADDRARRYLRWDIAQGRDLRNGLKAIKNSGRRALASEVLERSLATADRLRGKLRRSVIHGDANDHNLLVRDDGKGISAIIDFGDLVETWRVAEAAIAAAYVLLDNDRPVERANEVLAGYHSEWPLNESEIETFLPLVEIRLCMTVIHAALAADDGDKYSQIHAAAAWRALHALRGRNLQRGHYQGRAACGLVSAPQAGQIQRWLSANTAAFNAVIPEKLQSSPCLLDLSLGSRKIYDADDDIPSLSKKLFAYIESQGAFCGVGRYCENRGLYQSDLFLADNNNEPRTFHVGVDLFAQEDTPVMTPLDGRVLSVTDNNRDLDYGPTVIIEHDAGGQSFYTLFGHLSVATLKHAEAGQAVRAGDIIGWIGTYPRNGNWPPHVHFQIMMDMLDHQGDFPGVARLSEAWYWRGLCLNPNLVLGLDLPVDAAHDDPRQQLKERRSAVLSDSLSLSYATPLLINRGRGQYLYDHRNRAWLDLVNNVCHVGHCHPRVVDAVNRQMSLLNTNTRYLHSLILEYTERLTSLLPDSLQVCFLVSSGSEANELAVRLARAATGRRELVVLDYAYHGNTAGLVDMSPHKFAGPGGEGQAAHISVLPLPDSLPRRADGISRDAALAVLDKMESDKRLPAALFAETLPGCGGQRVLPDNFLAGIYRRVREMGGVCVADEVQTGLGRMGDCWWSFETQALVPDIVTMGKPLGNGHPLAAVVTTREIARQFASGMEYFNTFGGNPVSCAAGLAVLDIIEEDGLRENALKVGERMRSGLQELSKQHPQMADVRGHGLFLGVEIVEDFESLRPDAEKTRSLVEAMLRYGVMLGIDGPDHNVLKIKPPMVVDLADADYFLEKLGFALDQ